MKSTSTTSVLSRSLTAFAVTLSASFTWASPGAQVYLSGKQLAAKFAPVAKSEKGFRTTVPVDYANPEKGTTEIYAFFAQEFDPSQPTYVIFSGGPGQTAHVAKPQSEMPGFNTLYVDQRGVAFSRPESEELWNSKELYSSEYVARDFEEIRKSLGIEKWSVYGASYGTVPATIYASLFPEHTRALVLQGVIGGGFDDLPWRSYYVADRVQEYFDGLPGDLKQKIQRASNAAPGNEGFFPALVVQYLNASGRERLPELTRKLKANINLEDSKFWPQLMDMGFMPVSGANSDPSQIELHVHNMLMVKEFGFGRRDLSGSYALEDGKIQKTTDNRSYADFADKAGFPKGIEARKGTYDPAKFPVRVPVYYLQGDLDAATTPIWSIHHAAVSPQNGFQHFLFSGVGHMVREMVGQVYDMILARMLMGENLSQEELDSINMMSPYPAKMFSDRKSLDAVYKQYLVPRDCGDHVKK